MILVGTNSLGYSDLRNFAGLPFGDVYFKKVPDLFKIDAYFHFKVRGKIVPEYANRFNDLGFSNVHLYHFFNTITPRFKPWLVTFETTLPRLQPHFKQGYKWLAGKYCRKLIAISARAFNAQRTQLDKFPDHAGHIIPKMVILTPSQPLIVDSIDQKPQSGKLEITFVGSAFYRKGGVELLRAFTSANTKGNMHLNVVSRLEKEGYMDAHATSAVENEVKRTLASNANISYYTSLDNRSVMELFRRSQVGILPSYAETYGYSILEAMACGCAVVSTDLSPFPEFVHNEWGWLARVPKVYRDGLEHADVSTDSLRKNFSDALTEELRLILEQIRDSPVALRIKQQNAIEAIRSNHAPADRVRVLRDMYQSCL